MFYTYVLWGKENKNFYIGYTQNLERRLSEHKAGKVHTTYRFPSFELVFYEAFLSECDALRRERYFKTTKGKKALRLITQESVKMI